MPTKTALAAVAVAATLIASAAAPTMAASPAAGLAPLKSTGADQSPVEKTHGWHRKCRKGLNGWHKHAPGVGRIQCTTSKNCYTNVFGYRVCDWF